MSSPSDAIRVLRVGSDAAEGAGTLAERTADRVTIDTVSTASEGLDRLDAGNVDCVISDHDLLDRNGIEFLEAVREEYPDLPFVLRTRSGDEEVVTDALSAGATDCLRGEPDAVRNALLANRITTAVEQYRRNRDESRRRKRQNHQGEALIELTTDNAVTGGDFGTALERITETAADVLNVPRVNVWLFDDGGETLRCVDSFDGDSDSHRSGGTLLVDNTPEYFTALASSRSIAATNATEDPRTAELEGYLEAHDIGSLLDATIRSGGEVLGVVCHEHVGGSREWTDTEIEFANDISDLVHRAFRNRERAERRAQLERTRDLLQHTERVADVGGWEIDTDTLDVFWTDHLFALLGVEGDEEPPLEEALDVYHEEDRPTVEDAVETALGSGESFDIEARIRRSDGELRWLRIRGVPTLEDDEVVTLRGAILDITDRRRRERVLRDMYDIVSDRHRTFEEQVQALLELGRAELGTRYGTLSEIRGDEYVFQFVDSDDDTIQAGDTAPVSATNCELVATTERTLVLGNVERDAPSETDRAGFTEWGISCYIGAPVFVDDEVYGTFCFYDTEPRAGQFSDWEKNIIDLMSGWISSGLQRRRTNERLQEQNEQLEQFASIVSHDLRNPLNVAQGRLELAREECDSDHLSDVGGAQDRMGALIDDLLTLARAGDLVGETEPVDLENLAELCRQHVDMSESTVVIDADRTILADPGPLQQLLENLLRNAAEHAGEDVTVTIGDTDRGFYVEDDGSGIPEAERDEVFATGFSTADEGTGFGLNIVKQVAEAHGWTVRATEGSEGGARFDITGITVATE